MHCRKHCWMACMMHLEPTNVPRVQYLVRGLPRKRTEDGSFALVGCTCNRGHGHGKGGEEEILELDTRNKAGLFRYRLQATEPAIWCQFIVAATWALEGTCPRRTVSKVPIWACVTRMMLRSLAGHHILTAIRMRTLQHHGIPMPPSFI